MLALERMPILDVGPLKYELESSGDGRVVLDDDLGRRVAAIPTTRGDVCYVAGKTGRTVMSACVQSFPTSGVTTAYITSSTAVDPDEVFGLVAPGVTRGYRESQKTLYEMRSGHGAANWMHRAGSDSTACSTRPMT